MLPEHLLGIYKPENDIWGLPQEFVGLTLYPILISNKKAETLFYKYICVPKSHIQDADVLRMSYLKFLLLIVSTNLGMTVESVFDEVCELMSCITGIEKDEIIIDVQSDSDEASFSNIRVGINVGDVYIDESDFETLREILLIQNGLSLRFIEDYDPVMEQRLLAKTSQDKSTDEDRILVFASLLGKTIKEIKDYTLYQFKFHFQRMAMVEDFRMYKPLEISSGAASKGSKIKGYYSMEKQQGRYDSILLDKDAFVKESGLFSDSSVQTINK